MSEDRDLLDRIGKLAGHINLHRIQTPSEQDNQDGAFAPPQSWNRSTPGTPNSAPSWRSSRVAPYGGGRGRAAAVKPHRHRTLVIHNKVGTSPQATGETDSGTAQQLESSEVNEPSQTNSGWVSKRDRHIQLINSTIYDRETQVRNKAIDETRKQKALRRDQREKHKIERHLQSLAPSASPGVVTGTPEAVHEISINGLRFHVLDGGSKLARIRGPTDSGSATPKQAQIGGVTFLRSKNGNLYRSGVVKAKRMPGKFKKISELCKRFTLTDGSTGSAEDDDLVSDDDRDETDTDDIDSDGLEEDSMQLLDETTSQSSHVLSKQQDFVYF